MTRWRDLPDRRYDVILADPPWAYYGQQNKWGAAAKFYATAPDEAIVRLPIPDLLTDRGVLFLWATSPRLDVAMACLQAWQLHFRGIAFVWVKARKDGGPIRAQGVRPSIVKPTAEYVIAASRVAKGRPMKLADEAVSNVILAPRRAHSQKPDAVAEAIERLYPEASRLEMFARTLRPGWDLWGDEVGKFGADGSPAAP
ncbi:DNA methyltransferase [Sphingomonas changnyeongensis]|uniref:DNA methyltransferase n=1 Tax=Sphingomonas changnyeongensis TaxID=2698679 RepID=A0A7Z2NWM2_9SPHN|nr:MT-A70 family methyltransferase [Sphingomonas changnyeongensis]QHL90759.1 DNA methyltransferase [Sphingomonas changnyeongensis]